MKIFRCSSPDCPHSVWLTEENVSKEFVYLCPECTGCEEELHFQDHAFDPDLDLSREPEGTTARGGMSVRKKRFVVSELKSFVDLGLSTGRMFAKANCGFQIKKIRREARDTPEWAKTDKDVQKILLTAFPKLNESSLQRKRAGRWAQVIQLYFRQGRSFSEVADELNEKPRSIEMVIRGITWTSKGMRADGRGPRKNATT